MNVLHVASEVAPFAKTGGLADVVGALPRALAALGSRSDRVAVVLPAYQIDPLRFGLARRLQNLRVPVGGDAIEVGIFEGRLPGGGGAVEAWLIDHPLYDRPGLYGEGGHDYGDNALRFALLSRASLSVAHALGFDPHVIHAHDWQAAPTLLYARRGAAPDARTVLTIHNVAFQGLFSPSVASELGFGADLFHPEGIEFFGKVNFLKAGIVYADWITTVSPRYAREIQTPEFGAGLDGLLRARADRLVGILNGADYDLWNPARDPALAEPFTASRRDGKRACKSALQRELGLSVRARIPLFGAVSRLSDQKGFDLIGEALEKLLPEREMQVVILGSGEAALEQRLTALAARFPTKMAVRIGHDEPLAHRIYAGSDLFVMPSRWEPCGLAQLYAMRYGAPPIVRATGGLDDTVIDLDVPSASGNGFKFGAASAEALGATWRRALSAYAHPESFEALIGRAMAQDFSWARSAEAYRQLYLRR